MAEPFLFPECNLIVAPPSGRETEILSAPAFVVRNSLGAVERFILCWEFSDEEIGEIVKTKRVWSHIVSNRLPPSLLDAFSPFK